MTISSLVYSNKETCISDFYNFLAKILFHYHQDEANVPDHKYDIFYSQLISSHDKLCNIPYILIHLYGVKYIWEIVYSIIMNQIKNSEIVDDLTSLTKDDALASVKFFNEETVRAINSRDIAKADENIEKAIKFLQQALELPILDMELPTERVEA